MGGKGKRRGGGGASWQLSGVLKKSRSYFLVHFAFRALSLGIRIKSGNQDLTSFFY